MFLPYFLRRIVRRASYTLACGTLMASTAWAQAPTAPPKPPSLKPVDADGDGKITRGEWGRFAQMFSELDTNRDQAVDLAELQKATGDAETPGILIAADTNGDGKLVRPEWAVMSRAFVRLDVSRDEAVSPAELQVAIDLTTESLKPGGANSATPGLWRGRIVNGRGENPNSGQLIELLISGNRIAGRDAGPQSDPTPNLGIGTFVMTGNGKIGYLDAQYISGPEEGQICLGIFKMEGDALYWCASNRTGYRPAEFATGNGCWLMIMRKVEPPKK